MKGIVKFGNISVRQIMRSRLDVNGVDYEISLKDLINKVEELHYSRLPVYKGSLDEVAGIIHTKDLIPYLNERDGFDWHPLIRQPYFVPESKLIEDLLRDFQQKRIHFAIVVDEFGGTSGIVTMEDILEEVIGDIRDEFDDEETGNRKLDEKNYLVEGKTMLHDMCKLMRLPMDTFDGVRGDSESLAGHFEPIIYQGIELIFRTNLLVTYIYSTLQLWYINIDPPWVFCSLLKKRGILYNSSICWIFKRIRIAGLIK